MGCGGSKEAEDANKIKYEMKETKIPDFDSVSSSSLISLPQIEQIYSGSVCPLVFFSNLIVTAVLISTINSSSTKLATL